MGRLTSAVILALVALTSIAAADEAAKASGKLTVTLVERIGKMRFRHGSAIGKVYFRGDDEVVSWGGLRYRAFDAYTGQLKSEVSHPQYSDAVYDGDQLVLIAEPLVNGVRTQTFRVVNLDTGKQVARWVHPEWTESIATSSSKSFAVLANLARSVSIVEVENGREIDRFADLAPSNSRAGYPRVDLSPRFRMADSRLMAVWSRPDHVQFVEISDAGKVKGKLAKFDDGELYEVAFSSKQDEVLVISASGGALWNVRTEKQIAKWDGPARNRVSSAVFAEQGRIVAELANDVVSVREARTGKLLRSFPLRAHPRCDEIALSPDEKVLAAVGYQERIRFYDFVTGNEIRFDAKAETHGPVEAVAMSDDGEWIATTEHKGVVSLWNRDSGWQRQSLRDDDIRSKYQYDTHAGPNFLTFLPGEAKLLSGSSIYHNSLNVWDAATATRKQRFIGHGMPIMGVDVSRNGSVVASTSRDGTLRIWNSEGNELHRLQAAGHSLSLSPNGSLVAVALHREQEIVGEDGIPEPSRSVAAVELWSTKTGELVRSMEEVTSESYGFYSVSFSPDGRHVAANAADGLYVWDTATGKRSHRITLPRPAETWHFPNCGCAFSPTEAIVAASNGEGSIVFIDIAAKDDMPPAIVQGHNGPINALAWRHDGKFLVSGGNDATVVLWHVERR